MPDPLHVVLALEGTIYSGPMFPTRHVSKYSGCEVADYLKWTNENPLSGHHCQNKTNYPTAERRIATIYNRQHEWSPAERIVNHDPGTGDKKA